MKLNCTLRRNFYHLIFIFCCNNIHNKKDLINLKTKQNKEANSHSPLNQKVTETTRITWLTRVTITWLRPATRVRVGVGELLASALCMVFMAISIVISGLATSAPFSFHIPKKAPQNASLRTFPLKLPNGEFSHWCKISSPEWLLIAMFDTKTWNKFSKEWD